MALFHGELCRSQTGLCYPPGLIQKERLFTPEQMTEIYRCCADSVDGDFFELTGEQEKMIRSVQQQIEECVPTLDDNWQQEEALEQVAQQQTM